MAKDQMPEVSFLQRKCRWLTLLGSGCLLLLVGWNVYQIGCNGLRIIRSQEQYVGLGTLIQAFCCLEKWSQGKLWPTYSVESNHVTTRGPLAYKKGHSLREGWGADMKEELKVMENGTSTSADLRQGRGSNTDSGPTWLRQRLAPGQWKQIKGLTAI